MIITGCQRSGTMTMGSILGIAHEVNFTPLTTWQDINKLDYIPPESSWLAQPFAEILKEKEVPIIHLIRHPINVIASLLGIRFWEGADHEPYREFIIKHLPGIKTFLNHSMAASMFYWIYWNKPLEQFPRIQLETIRNAPILNSRPRAQLKWTDIPKNNLKRLVEEKAEEYGYGF